MSALALPAASVPPTSVAMTSQTDGNPPCGEQHRRHGGDQQQLDDPRLGERHVRRDLRPARTARCTAGAPGAHRGYRGPAEGSSAVTRPLPTGGRRAHRSCRLGLGGGTGPRRPRASSSRPCRRRRAVPGADAARARPSTDETAVNAVDPRRHCHRPLTWTDLDERAVDTVRVLAADAVQKVGNGHPGTAMSLAPAAYLLFQQLMRHDPSDPHWLGPRPVRALLRALQPDPVHPALPVRLRPGARRPQGAAHLGLADPRPPGVQAHRRVSRSPPARSARAWRPRSAWRWPPGASAGLLDPDAAPGESPFDHTIWVIASDGDLQEGVTSEAVLAGRAPGARQPRRASTTRTTSRSRTTPTSPSPRTSSRATRPTAGTPSASTGPRPAHYVEDVAGARRRAARPPRPRPTSRRSSRCARSSAGPRPTKQNTGKIHGSALGDDEVAALKRVLGFDPEQTFEVDDDVLAHARAVVDRGAALRRELGRGLTRPGGAATPTAPRCWTG